MSIAAAARRSADAFRRRLDGDVSVDPWGLDVELCDALRTLATPGAHVTVDGGGHLPVTGPCVLVVNRRFGWPEPMIAARAVHQVTMRRARFLGVPEVPVLDTLWRRAGGAQDRPEELAGLLRHGALVVVLLSPERSRGRAGELSPERLSPALDLGVPVVPMALLGGELTGRWHAHVGPPVRRPAGRSPLSRFDLAAAARAGVQALLDEALPPRWPFG